MKKLPNHNKPVGMNGSLNLSKTAPYQALRFTHNDLAERVGFEPTVATRTTTVFETVPFDHSGTSP